MQALIGGRWRTDVLEYHRGPAEYRIQVSVWQVLEPVEGLYFERPRSIRLLLTYVREFGLRQVVLKVASRAQERGRNRKYVAWGVGRVTEGSDHGRHRAGDVVAFLAPVHPECVERIALPEGLLVGLDALPSAPATTVRCLSPAAREADPWWRPALGWSASSGQPVPSLPLERLRSRAESLGEKAPATQGAPAPTPMLPVRGTTRPARGRPTAVLFGYGNYTKTAVLPGIARSLSVQRVHEIDPTQIPRDTGDLGVWDTSPVPGPERYDAYLIAGFHHTHTALALTALERGSYAVVEKPVAVSREALTRLVEAVRRSPRLFACFHRRYSPLNGMALADLGVRPGERIDYHCIVSEVGLPPLHWYRWPVSGSRLVANGCHWVDHFIHLNGYAAVVSRNLFLAPDGTVHCSAVLDNGAVFSRSCPNRS